MNSISFFKALLMKEMEEASFTDKYNDSPKLKGGQKNLPDELQAQLVKNEDKESELEKYERILHQLQNMNRSSNPSDESTKRKKIEDLKKKIAKLKSKVTEGEDHEVSMAHNSLESVIKSAMELKAKLGDNEKDIPAWIQDHITNAENYINQASKNYHEYSNSEHDMDELPDGTVELPAGDEEDLDMSLQGLMETVKNKKKKK